MLDAEQVPQGVEQCIEQCRKVARTGETPDRAAQLREGRRTCGHWREFRAIELRHGVDAVDVRSTQPEHAGHARVRRNPGQLGLHALEQRPGVLGPQVRHGQLVLLARVGVDHDQGRTGVLQHVLPCLAEKLVRKGDVCGVDVVDFGDVGDVRRAVASARRDHGGCGAFEARADRMQREVHGQAGNRWPAAGPGVCSKAASGLKVIATSSVGSPRTARANWDA